ncbi:MAG: hypothetical protein M3N59_01635 [bacterium]|nr:hypothetical protein [bacterium]
MKRRHLALIAILAGIVGVPAAAGAFSASSPSYRLDDATLNSFGGTASSPDYELTSSGGEPFVGPGVSESYKFNAGYVAQLEHSITLTLDSTTKTIPEVDPGSSETAETTASVYTDAAGYTLSVRQDHDLRHEDGSTTIPAIAGTIASPTPWNEGTTEGFGFTLTAGTSLDSKWGTSPNFEYAAFPASNTIIHTKPGYVNAYDDTTLQYRLDVSPVQLPGSYSSHITFSAIVVP